MPLATPGTIPGQRKQHVAVNNCTSGIVGVNLFQTGSPYTDIKFAPAVLVVNEDSLISVKKYLKT